MGKRHAASWGAGLALLVMAHPLAVAQSPALDLHAFVNAEQPRLYAVEYARSHAVDVGRLVRGGGADAVDMSWYFFVVVGGGRVALVDCGTDAFARAGREALRQRWSIRQARTVTEALARVGLMPEEVTDIVLTHHHWDHVGALALFESARVHAHVDEWRAVPQRLRAPVEATRRLRLIEDVSAQLWSGLSVREAGRHTAHQLMVDVACEGGEVVVASDAAYLYRSIDEGLASAVSTDRRESRRDIASARARVGADHVVPGHDPELFVRHASPVPGVAAICP